MLRSLIENLNLIEGTDNNLYHPGSEIETSNLRIHRYNPSIEVLDLTNAGKRGKTVQRLSFEVQGHAVSPQVWNVVDKLPSAKNYAEVVALLKDAGIDYYEDNHRRGVDVPPGGFKDIEVNTDKVYIRAELLSFSVRDKTDMHNEPTLIPGRSDKAGIKKFYNWVKDNYAVVQGMNFDQVSDAMDKLGIRTHYYCAVD